MQLAYLGNVQNFLRPSQLLAFRSRIPTPSPHSFTHQAALKLRESTQDRENHLAGRRGRVDTFGETHEFDSGRLKRFQGPQFSIGAAASLMVCMVPSRTVFFLTFKRTYEQVAMETCFRYL